MLAHLWHWILYCALMLAPLPLATWLAGRDRDERPFGHDLLVVAMLSVVSHITLALLLGAVGLMTGPVVYGGAAVLAVAGNLLHARRPGRPLRWIPGPALRSVHLGVVYVGWILGGATLWGVMAVPTDNYDSFAYHLPAIAWWLQDGGFRALPDLLHAEYYAYNWELVSLIGLFPLSGDLMMAAPNLFAWAMLGLACALAARHYGAGWSAALAAPMLLLVSKSLLTRVDATQPDIALAAFFVAGLYFGELALRGRSPWPTAWCALCVLSLPGLKMSGLVHAPILFAGLVLPRLLRDRSLPRPAFVAKDVLPFAALGLFLGGFWYARNFALTGNPFGFLSVGPFEGDIARAELARTALANVFDASDAADWKILANVGWEWLGPGFALLVVAALVACVVAWRRGDAGRVAALSFAVWVVLGIYAYWTAPYSGDNGSHGYELTPWINVGLRYAYPLFAVIAVFAALGLQAMRLRGFVALGLVALAGFHAAVLPMKFAALPMRWSVGSGFVLLALLHLRDRLPSRLRVERALPAAFGLGAIVLGVLAYGHLERRDVGRERSYGRVHRYLEEAIPPDVTVAYARTHRRYQLFGNRLTREVLAFDPDGRSMEEWLADLRASGARYLAVGTADDSPSQREGVPDVREWIAANPERFSLTFPAQSSRKDLAIYRIR